VTELGVRGQGKRVYVDFPDLSVNFSPLSPAKDKKFVPFNTKSHPVEDRNKD